jgi:hypothetical protein
MEISSFWATSLFPVQFFSSVRAKAASMLESNPWGLFFAYMTTLLQLNELYIHRNSVSLDVIRSCSLVHADVSEQPASFYAGDGGSSFFLNVDTYLPDNILEHSDFNI